MPSHPMATQILVNGGCWNMVAWVIAPVWICTKHSVPHFSDFRHFLTLSFAHAYFSHFTSPSGSHNNKSQWSKTSEHITQKSWMKKAQNNTHKKYMLWKSYWENLKFIPILCWIFLVAVQDRPHCWVNFYVQTLLSLYNWSIMWINVCYLILNCFLEQTAHQEYFQNPTYFLRYCWDHRHQEASGSVYWLCLKVLRWD